LKATSGKALDGSGKSRRGFLWEAWELMLKEKEKEKGERKKDPRLLGKEVGGKVNLKLWNDGEKTVILE